MHRARGMVITVEIKHHQLWGFSTFHSVPRSLSPPEAHSPLAPTQTTLAATPSGPQPSLLPPLFFPLLSTRLRSSTSTCLLYPSIYFPLIFSASLHPLTLSIFTLFFLSFAEHPFIHNPLAKIALFPILRAPPSLNCTHTHTHACTHTNDHIRQMTLITVCLECENTEKRRPKHLLHIPNAFRDPRLLCTLMSLKK